MIGGHGKCRKKLVSFTMIAILILGVLAGCGKKAENTPTPGAQPTTPAPKAEEISGTVTASGSSALLPLVKEAAKDFMDKNPKVTINVTAGGSGTGLKNVADGTSDIGNSDVAAGDEYKDKGLVDHVAAIAPFALIVNKDVTIDNLTKQQAADILTGKIKNWKEVNGKDAPIVIVHRAEGSGSRKLVQQIVLDNKEFTKEGVVQDSSGAMKTAVASTPGAIGYVDTPYVDDSLKALKFEGVAFSKDAIQTKKISSIWY